MEKILTVLPALFFCLLLPGKALSQTNDADDVQGTYMASPEHDSPDRYVRGITSMRARSLAGIVSGLSSLVIGWRARNRRMRGAGNKGRKGAFIALFLGAFAILLSLVHLSSTAGAVFGSGSGKAGAILALLLGLAGMVVSMPAAGRKNPAA